MLSHPYSSILNSQTGMSTNNKNLKVMDEVIILSRAPNTWEFLANQVLNKYFVGFVCRTETMH